MIVVCDVDGTFIDHSHRIPIIEGDNRKDQKNWDRFYSNELLALDTPIPEGVIGLLRLCNAPYTRVNLVTGRPERTRFATKKWMRAHEIPELPLFMRREGDLRKATIYKRDVLQMLTQNYPGQAMLFIDDDERNYEMYKSYGLVLMAPACWRVLL